MPNFAADDKFEISHPRIAWPVAAASLLIAFASGRQLVLVHSVVNRTPPMLAATAFIAVASASFSMAPRFRDRVNRDAAMMANAPNAGVTREFLEQQMSVVTECMLLPNEPYAGEPHLDFVGEVMLQELEDKEETRTQLFFKKDGTIVHGATDGPPPAGFCGLWQCGKGQFQMTLSRTYAEQGAMTGHTSMKGHMEEDIVYTVCRIFEGDVDLGSTGVGAVSGSIQMITESEAEAARGQVATSMAALDSLSAIPSPPIGYFVLDANTIDEVKRMIEDGDPVATGWR